MKTSIEVNKIVTETIEVELPYYYVEDFSDDYNQFHTYGKICEERVITIDESKDGYGDCHQKIMYHYEMEKDPNLRDYASIFNSKSMASSKSCFDAALDRAIKFMQENR